MADNDIYDNKRKFEHFVEHLNSYADAPNKVIKKGEALSPKERRENKRKYHIKFKENTKYFRELFRKFEAKDLSYIRRLRLCRVLLMACYVLDKDLSKVEREDIDKLMSFAHTVNKSVKSKKDFVVDIKHMWRQLFPETDERGRIDENLTPYPVRHLSSKIERAKERMRGDKFSLEEFEKLVSSFGDDPRMQALLTVSIESLGRPQEILGRKINDVEMHDNYAKIYITEHGKEGTGFLRIIDSYFYLQKWLNVHPLKKDKNSYLFINTGRLNRYQQLKPPAANKLIRERCEKLGIGKGITLYSLKRNGVTMMRLQGKSDLDIQHTARWSSTQQLKTYDMSEQEESFKLELIKRDKIKPSKEYKQFAPTSRKCVFCGFENGAVESVCSNCKRPLDREVIEKEANENAARIAELEKKMEVVWTVGSEKKRMQSRKHKHQGS